MIDDVYGKNQIEKKSFLKQKKRIDLKEVEKSDSWIYSIVLKPTLMLIKLKRIKICYNTSTQLIY